MHLIRSLHKLHGDKYHVEVYGDARVEDAGFRDGAAWYPGAWLSVSCFPNPFSCGPAVPHCSERLPWSLAASWYDGGARPVDVFIAWRYPISISLATHAKAVYIWLHDVSCWCWFTQMLQLAGFAEVQW